MTVTVLYPEGQIPDDTLERAVFGPEVRLVLKSAGSLAELADADCAEIDGLMISRFSVTEADMARLPRLRAIVRMGVGYDRLARPAAAKRNILICNVPDYGTTEVADHALALLLALRRGILQHHDAQRRTPPAPWRPIPGALVRRTSVQTLGIIGLGRIGTAAALRARAFGFRVVFYDPYPPERRRARARHRPRRHARGAAAPERCAHPPHAADAGDAPNAGARPARAAAAGRGGGEHGARADHRSRRAGGAAARGHIAGAGLDVVPEEPPVEPLPDLIRAYRAREPWLEGRLVITPHAAYYSPEALHDTRVKAAETMRAALLTNAPKNVITPEMF